MQTNESIIRARSKQISQAEATIRKKSDTSAGYIDANALPLPRACASINGDRACMCGRCARRGKSKWKRTILHRFAITEVVRMAEACSFRGGLPLMRSSCVRRTGATLFVRPWAHQGQSQDSLGVHQDESTWRVTHEIEIMVAHEDGLAGSAGEPLAVPSETSRTSS